MANGGVVAARSQSPEPQDNFGDMVLSFCVGALPNAKIQSALAPPADTKRRDTVICGSLYLYCCCVGSRYIYLYLILSPAQ